MGKSESIRANVVVFGKKWFYSGRSGCIRVKVVVFGQGCCIRAESCCSQAGCIRTKVVLFGQSRCIWAKLVEFQQNWLYSG